MTLNPAQTFDRIQRAQAAWTRGGATVVASNATVQGVKRVRFRLDLDGAGGATLRIQSPAQGRYAATDQGFSLRGGTLTGFDYDAGETIRRLAPDRGSIGLRLTAALSGVDDAIGFLTDPGTRKRYLDPLRALSGWQNTGHGLFRRTTAMGKASLTRLDLDAAGRLRALHIALPGSRLDWSIDYGPARPLPTLRRPKRVEAFTARLRPPHYANAQARTVVERMLRVASGVQSAIIRLDSAATLWIAGSRVRYEASGTGFAFDGRTLTVESPRAVYQGRSSRGRVIDAAVSVLGGVDPFVRGVLVRAVPFAELFPPNARVRRVGSGIASGQPCDIVDVESPSFHTSIFVRKADGLPLSIETGALDGRGNQLTTTRRSLTWQSVNAPLPRSLFTLRLRSGGTVLPLPKRTATGP